MKKLNKKETLLELIRRVRKSGLKYICPDTNNMFASGLISENMCNWVKSKMKAKKIPVEFHGENFVGFSSTAMWRYNEEEMRVKYLEYLIEQL